MIDRSDIGTVIEAMYACISGPAGPRDWATQREIFHPESRQARTWLDPQGRPAMRLMDREAYAADVAPFFAQTGFYEVELQRRIDVFGNMAHVWSLYEARLDLNDPAPERRGINSIQLCRGPDGLWSILHMIWDNERPGLSLPD